MCMYFRERGTACERPRGTLTLGHERNSQWLECPMRRKMWKGEAVSVELIMEVLTSHVNGQVHYPGEDEGFYVRVKHDQRCGV